MSGGGKPQQCPSAFFLSEHLLPLKAWGTVSPTAPVQGVLWPQSAAWELISPQGSRLGQRPL